MEEEAERRGGKKVVLAYLGSSNNVEATTIIMVKQQGNNNMRKEGSHDAVKQDVQSRETYDILGLVQPSFACLNVFSIKILYVLI